MEYDFTSKMAYEAIVEGFKAADITKGLVPWIGVGFFLVGSGLFFILNIFVVEAFITAFVFLLTTVLMRWELHRRAKHLSKINKHFKWEINEKELKSSTEGAETRFVWEKLLKIHERKNGFLLFPQKYFCYWLPKNAFRNESDVEWFRNVIKSKPLKFIC